MAMQLSPLYQDSWKVMICETLEVIEVVVLVDKAGPLLVVVEGVEEAQKKCVEVEVEPVGQEAPQYLEVDPGLGPPGPGRPLHAEALLQLSKWRVAQVLLVEIRR